MSIVSILPFDKPPHTKPLLFRSAKNGNWDRLDAWYCHHCSCAYEIASCPMKGKNAITHSSMYFRSLNSSIKTGKIDQTCYSWTRECKANPIYRGSCINKSDCKQCSINQNVNTVSLRTNDRDLSPTLAVGCCSAVSSTIVYTISCTLPNYELPWLSTTSSTETSAMFHQGIHTGECSSSWLAISQASPLWVHLELKTINSCAGLDLVQANSPGIPRCLLPTS